MALKGRGATGGLFALPLIVDFPWDGVLLADPLASESRTAELEAAAEEGT
jgi:hypothetical protein